MAVDTTITGASHRIKLEQREINLEIEGTDSSTDYVTEINVEGENGENIYRIHIFSKKTAEFYRLTTGEAADLLDPAKKLLESGKLIRQVDSLSPQTRRPLPTGGDDD
tara:strand:- start:6020 stop:6343 length:324 start_codon:yes stop_codon:yes gene_type:complete